MPPAGFKLPAEEPAPPGSAPREPAPPLVLVGVTGGIAAYKACELVRTLQKGGCRVKVVMTESATHLVGPATFRALTGDPVAVSLWDEPSAKVHHVGLAEEADVLVIAPATANVCAKLASGRADDLLTTVALATEAPLVVAPAMNVHMWRNPITQKNLAQLKSRGIRIVDPGIGELACGDVGEGRLATVEAIAEAVHAEVRRTQALSGARVLVYAGRTEEPIDFVRVITNRSSGKTGFAIADEAARRGADVLLVTGPSALPDPFDVDVVRVTTAQQMHDVVIARAPQSEVIVACAAVSDFRPKSPSLGKAKKYGAPLVIELERTPDILAELGARKAAHQLLVGFAAETSDVLGSAARKLTAKNLDLVVANNVASEGLGFGSDDNKVWVVGGSAPEAHPAFESHPATAERPAAETRPTIEELPVMDKQALARALWDRIALCREARREAQQPHTEARPQKGSNADGDTFA